MKRFVIALLIAGCDGDLRFTAASVDAGDAKPAAETARLCATDEECPFPSLHCEPSTGACVPCVRDEHCGDGERRRCDLASRRCVECGVSADCEADERCDGKTHACMRPCGGDAGGCGEEQPTCDAPRAVCVCSATSCGSGKQCDATSGACVECLVDAHCGGDRARCVERRCHACRTDEDCGNDRCDPVKHECVD